MEDCLIHEIGRIEKQVAGVEIDMAMNITVSHCSICDTPRPGINIGDGCWGGHVIEFCDVFDTVLETGDHGSFNSWGRDRLERFGKLVQHVGRLVDPASLFPSLGVFLGHRRPEAQAPVSDRQGRRFLESVGLHELLASFSMAFLVNWAHSWSRLVAVAGAALWRERSLPHRTRVFSDW